MAPSELVVVDQWGREVDMAAAAARSGMTDRPFNPGMPMPPYAGYGATPREQDYPAGYNIAARPRRDERVDFSTLRGLIDSYDIAQICMWHRINSVRSLAWSLVAKPGVGGPDVDAQIEEGRRALERPDGVSPFSAWLASYVYDVLAYDAGALYRQRNNAGQCIGLKVIDGTTLAPLLDYWGGTPAPPAPAFVQFSQGIVWDQLTLDDLIYVPFQPTSGSPYGKAPIETVLLNANTDLRFQAYFLQRFTSGTVPEAFASAPEGWKATQLEEFQEQWDALLYGDPEAKHQVKWVPHGTTFAWSNEKDYNADFSKFLAVKTAAAFHVVPSDIGLLDDVNRATSETQSDVQFRTGDLPLIQHIEGILTRYLQHDLGLALEFAFDTGQEKEDRLNTAQADAIYIQNGVISPSEPRRRVYGLEEPDGVEVPRYIFSGRAGPIPLSALIAVAGPTDPESGAPKPGGPLPHKPFALIEGVAPQKPPSAEPLAVQQYPAENAPSVQAAAVAAEQPVAKAADVQLADAAVDVMKAELATFARFVKGRRRAGEWRDFAFDAVDPRLAGRLNQAGRAEVRKAAGQIVAAGLAVVADDTGRVLMLQRALDPADPAAGMWELPGGCLEPGEEPLGAAWREWQEETGCHLGQVTGVPVEGWTSSSGVYVGFVLHIPSEDTLPINLGTGRVLNPDDPDGDGVEVLAWWDPQLLPGNPSVRAELGADVDVVLAALAGDVAVVKAGGAGPKVPSRSTPTTFG